MTERAKHLRELVLKRDGYRCQNCQSTDNLDAHHIVPLCLGGNDIITNMITLCGECHEQAHKSVHKGRPHTGRQIVKEIEKGKKMCKGCHNNVDLEHIKCPYCYHRDFAEGDVYAY